MDVNELDYWWRCNVGYMLRDALFLSYPGNQVGHQLTVGSGRLSSQLVKPVGIVGEG